MMAVITFILLLASFAMPSFMTIVVRAHEARRATARTPSWTC
jgi:hypothetical protein